MKRSRADQSAARHLRRAVRKVAKGRGLILRRNGGNSWVVVRSRRRSYKRWATWRADLGIIYVAPKAPKALVEALSGLPLRVIQ